MHCLRTISCISWSPNTWSDTARNRQAPSSFMFLTTNPLFLIRLSNRRSRCWNRQLAKFRLWRKKSESYFNPFCFRTLAICRTVFVSAVITSTCIFIKSRRWTCFGRRTRWVGPRTRRSSGDAFSELVTSRSAITQNKFSISKREITRMITCTYRKGLDLCRLLPLLGPLSSTSWALLFSSRFCQQHWPLFKQSSKLLSHNCNG